MPNPLAGDSQTTVVDLFLWPLHAMNAWSALARLAPHTLTQPILPGLTVGNVYNVTESNSNAPQTEHEIVSEHSYGRQLGRMTDALSVVVAKLLREGELSAADTRRLADFTELARSIEEIKSREAMKRVEHMAEELSRLKQTQPVLYTRAVEVLQPVLPPNRG